MSRKIIYIISTLLIIILIGLATYYFLNGNEKTPGQSPNIFKNFFPFGGNDDEIVTPNPETPIEPTASSTDKFTQKLRKTSENPVAGAGTLDVKAGTLVRYIEKATGHIYEAELFSSQVRRISNTTIPVVAEALWGNKNKSLVARYLKDDNQSIDTYLLNLKETATTSDVISGISIPGDITHISISGETLFYLERREGFSLGLISNFSGGNKKQIWNSPLRELNSQFVNPRTVALTTKPEQNIPGYLYFVDTANGSAKKVLGNISGLSALVSPDAKTVLYSRNGAESLLFSFVVSENTSTSLTPVTFPEKCAWSKKNTSIIYCGVPKGTLSGGSLILWYKGLLTTVDDVWKIDTKNNTSSLVLDLSIESGESVDVTQPILSENEQYFVFTNKKDNNLWTLDLTK
jgi:hypothetical protein